MRLTVLGSGTGIPSATRGSPGYLVRSEGTTLLVDCGPGSLRRAAGEGISPAGIDAVLLTHFHPDHTLDLMALLFCLRNRGAFGERGPLEVVAPVGFSEVLEHWWAGPQGKWLEPADYEFGLREIDEGEHEIGRLRVRAIHVEHTPESLGYRIREREGEGVIAYSGDTGPCEGAVELGRGAEVYLLECARPEHDPQYGHLTAGQAGEIAARSRPGRLVLTHFYPDVEEEPVEEIVGRIFAGPVERAVDGMSFEVNG